MIVKANAKLNLSLDITGVREDGYHIMDMVMQSVTLSDTIEILPSDSGVIEILSDSRIIPLGETNLIYKAAAAIADYCNVRDRGLRILLRKNIPVEAGLGGGSADAAATLKALRKLWNLSVSDETLAEIGLSIGSDIPFCLQGGTAAVGGIGERIQPIKPLSGCFFVVAVPNEGVSTKNAFQLIDAVCDYQKPSTARLIEAIGNNDLSEAASLMINVFDTSGVTKASSGLINLIRSYGAAGASLSGSGSAAFGLFTGIEEAKKCTELLNVGYRCWLCEPASCGVEFL